MSRALGVVAVIALGAILIMAVPFLWLATEAPARPVCGFIDGGLIVTVPDSRFPSGRLDAEQSFYASVIVSEVLRRGLPVRAAEEAIATAIVESNLRNLPGGDADSVGLFQQRLSFYTTINPLDPVQATNAYLDRLIQVPGWETMKPGDPSATVQRPLEIYEGRYAEHMASAAGIVMALWAKAGTLPACARGEVLAGAYTLPVAKEIFAANPNYLTKPHHTYPAADIPLTAGTPVYAVTGGVVIASPVGGDCGNGVGILGDDGVEYIYCHGEVALAPVGAHVSVGELIMRSGWSGHVEPPGPAGAHLHLQLRIPGGPLVCPQAALVAWSQGQAVNPLSLATSGCTN